MTLQISPAFIHFSNSEIRNYAQIHKFKTNSYVLSTLEKNQ